MFMSVKLSGNLFYLIKSEKPPKEIYEAIMLYCNKSGYLKSYSWCPVMNGLKDGSRWIAAVEFDASPSPSTMVNFSITAFLWPVSMMMKGAQLTILIWFYFLRFAFRFVMFHAKQHKRLEGYEANGGIRVVGFHFLPNQQYAALILQF